MYSSNTRSLVKETQKKIWKSDIIYFVKSWPTGSVLQNSFPALFHIRLKQIKVRCVKDKRSEKLTPLSSGIHNNRAGGGNRGKKISLKLKLTSAAITKQKWQEKYNKRESMYEISKIYKYLKKLIWTVCSFLSETWRLSASATGWAGLVSSRLAGGLLPASGWWVHNS